MVHSRRAPSYSSLILILEEAELHVTNEKYKQSTIGNLLAKCLTTYITGVLRLRIVKELRVTGRHLRGESKEQVGPPGQRNDPRKTCLPFGQAGRLRGDPRVSCHSNNGSVGLGRTNNLLPRHPTPAPMERVHGCCKRAQWFHDTREPLHMLRPHSDSVRRQRRVEGLESEIG